MRNLQLGNVFGLLTVFALAAGACSSPSGDPTSPTLQNAAPSALTSAAGQAPPGARFDGRVASADPASQSFQLGDGTVVRVNATTQWKQSGPRLGSLAALATALTSGAEVRAKGSGQTEASGAIVADRVDARAEGGRPTTRVFRGNATTADSIGGTLTLSTDLTVGVDATTRWKRGPQRVTSLEQLETALLAGAGVYIKGKGATTDDGTVQATELDARLRSSALARFRGQVAAVDETGALLLADGTVIRVFDATRWKKGGRWLSSVEAIEAALTTGGKVRLAGKGTSAADGSILAAIVRAKVKPGGDEDDDDGADDGEDDETN